MCNARTPILVGIASLVFFKSKVLCFIIFSVLKRVTSKQLGLASLTDFRDLNLPSILHHHGNMER